MSSKIGNIFFIIILAGLVLYVGKSGIVENGLKALVPNGSSSISSGGLGWFRLGPVSSGSQSYFNGTSGSITNGSNVAADIFSTSTIRPTDIPSGFTLAQLSPYFHTIHIWSTSYGDFWNYGQITLGVSIPPSSTINITGWKLQGNAGGEYIPQAINMYDPSGLTPASDIFVKNQDTIYLYSSPGPFNLRLNKCIGYIANQNKTNPRIPGNCPGPDYGRLSKLSGACQNAVQGIGWGCSVPTTNQLTLPQGDSACVDYVQSFNYAGCVAAHGADADFLSHQIWIWTGNNIVNQYHDRIELLDKNGLLVDVHEY